MRIAVSLLAVCCWLVAAAAAEDDAAKKELDSMQGEWRVVSFISDGKPVPEDQRKDLKVTIKGDKWIDSEVKDKTNESTIKLDPAKKPKTIDLTALTSAAKGTVAVGIYSLKGDVLKVCVNNYIGGAKRPTELKGAEGVNLFVFKREKK